METSVGSDITGAKVIADQKVVVMSGIAKLKSSLRKWRNCWARYLFFTSYDSRGIPQVGQYHNIAQVLGSVNLSVDTSPAHKPDNTSPDERQLLFLRRERWINHGLNLTLVGTSILHRDDPNQQ